MTSFSIKAINRDKNTNVASTTVTKLQTVYEQQFCLHLNAKVEIKNVKSVRVFFYVVLDSIYVVDDAVLFSEYSTRFSNFFNNDPRVQKSEVT